MAKKKILNVKGNEITILQQSDGDFMSCFNYGEIATIKK